MKKVEISEAINMARDGHSLEGVAISNLDEVQVKVKDVLLLSEYGVVVPEQNIYYDDAEVAYDSEFDEGTWTRLPSGISLEDQAKMAADFVKVKAGESRALNIELEIEDKEINEWASDNYDKIKRLLSKFVSDLYEARTIIEK